MEQQSLHRHAGHAPRGHDGGQRQEEYDRYRLEPAREVRGHGDELHAGGRLVLLGGGLGGDQGAVRRAIRLLAFREVEQRRPLLLPHAAPAVQQGALVLLVRERKQAPEHAVRPGARLQLALVPSHDAVAVRFAVAVHRVPALAVLHREVLAPRHLHAAHGPRHGLAVVGAVAVLLDNRPLAPHAHLVLRPGAAHQRRGSSEPVTSVGEVARQGLRALVVLGEEDVASEVPADDAKPVPERRRGVAEAELRRPRADVRFLVCVLDERRHVQHLGRLRRLRCQQGHVQRLALDDLQMHLADRLRGRVPAGEAHEAEPLAPALLGLGQRHRRDGSEGLEELPQGVLARVLVQILDEQVRALGLLEEALRELGRGDADRLCSPLNCGDALQEHDLVQRARALRLCRPSAQGGGGAGGGGRRHDQRQHRHGLPGRGGLRHRGAGNHAGLLLYGASRALIWRAHKSVP
mmetsp:Transcript_88227/g.249843  ORF Transcript_88227/g.249843 Transcript_88227/m.249843 type:complete len:463 (+) Transcript_88227:61-1449(+)